MNIALGVIIGGILGAAVGYAGKCAGGVCPLTCNPIGGTLVGAALGMIFATTQMGGAEVKNPSKALINVSSGDQLDLLVKSNKVVLVDFYSDSCPPCRRLKPTIHELADAYEGKAVVAMVNVGKWPALAASHGVSGIPDVRVWKSGAQVAQFLGYRDKVEYTRTLDESLR